GYDCPVSGEFDRQTRIVVEAFQRRFRRARIDGIADSATRRTAALISRQGRS
ncbi:MAG: peptidoglycan-binding protein, partial [Rhizobiaceae bacterium]